jgi:hypothetical protein
MRQSTIRVLAVVSALTVGASGAVTLVAGSPAAAMGPARQAPPPKHWDKHLAPIAKQVEKLRHLKFKHPIKATLLSDKDFRKRLAADSGHLSKADKRDIAQSEAQLRALGLIDDKVDLLKAVKHVEDEGVDGFYDQHTKEMVVKGTKFDASTRVTVAHELTHALQDQWFDLDKLQKQSDKTHSGGDLQALVEGDATRVENDYVDGLTREEQDAYDAKQSDQDAKQQGAALKSDVTPIVLTLFAAPYVLGPIMVQAVVSYRENAAVDGLFRHSPTTDLSFMQPLSLFARQTTKKVATPKLAKGEKKSGDTDVFGAFPLFLTLASRIDTQPALVAAEQWAGDSSVPFKRGKTECLRTSFAGKNDAGTKAIGDALTSWSAAWPEGHAKVEVTPKLAILTSCDPGQLTGAKPRDVSGALSALAVRNEISFEVLDGGSTKEQAKCAGDKLTQDAVLLALIQQANDAGGAPPADVMARVQSAVAPCGIPGS